MRPVYTSLALAALALLPSCDIPDAAAQTVSRSVIAGVHAVGDEHVLDDLERIGRSEEIHHILTDLTRDLIATAGGAARGPEVEASLRALIALAIGEVRASLADVPAALGTSMDELLTDAEAMVSRVVRRAMQDARAMIDGDDVSGWVRGLVRDVLGDIVAMAEDALDDGSAEAIGAWLRRAFVELLRDVELEESTERLARAAARGFSQGIAAELRNDAGLGGALRAESAQLASSFSDASHEAAQPWIFVVVGLLAAMGIGGWFFYRTNRDHNALKEALERDGSRPARDVIQEARTKGVKVAAREPTLPPPDGPME